MGNDQSEPLNETTGLLKSDDKSLFTDTCKKLDQACHNYTKESGHCFDCGFTNHSMYCSELKAERLDKNLPIWSKAVIGVYGTCCKCKKIGVYASSMGIMLCERHAQEVIAGLPGYFPRQSLIARRTKDE